MAGPSAFCNSLIDGKELGATRVRSGGCAPVLRAVTSSRIASPSANGRWTEKILASFPNSKYDAAGPFASVVFDSAGNLYGTTAAGGRYFGNGTVFELSPGAGGAWTQKVLHSFGRDSSDGPPRMAI